MPKMRSLVQRQQDALKATGIGADQVRITNIERDPDNGRDCIQAELSPELAAELQKLASIRLHDPSIDPSKLSVSANGIRYDIEFEGEEAKQDTSSKQWTKTEHERRSKPKPNKPETPDR